MKYFILLIALFLFACTSTENKRVAVGKVNGKLIYIDEVDKINENKIYDILNHLHNLRKVALNQMINNELLKEAAIKRNQTTQQLLDSIFHRKQYTRKLTRFYTKERIKHNRHSCYQWRD